MISHAIFTLEGPSKLKLPNRVGIMIVAPENYTTLSYSYSNYGKIGRKKFFSLLVKLKLSRRFVYDFF